MNTGPAEFVVVLVVALVVFGPTKLPQLARALGQAVREFREGIDEKHPH
jgi:sec-independent protein translocase protein TatA